MIDVKKLLYEISGDERVFDEGTDLVESEILDSYAVIELFERIEEETGAEIVPTRIDRDLLRTVGGIEKLIETGL